MIKKVLLVLGILLGSFATAQQDSQFTQYLYNTVNINPAYAGSRGAMTVFALHRNQWNGIEGAPTTNTFALNTPINNSNFGVGMSVINDKIGPSDENTLAADISYSIATSENYKLSFGLKITANILSVDFNKLTIYNPTDNLTQAKIDNALSPNTGFGLYYHSNSFYLGLSVPNLFETQHFDKSASNLAASKVIAERLHYYFIAGQVFPISDEIKFKPAFLTKIVQGAPLQMDLSASFLFNEKLTLGVAYRWDAAFSCLAGFKVSDSWFIGYGFDKEVTKLSNYNTGSHEFFLRYEWFKKYNRIVSPRFF